MKVLRPFFMIWVASALLLGGCASGPSEVSNGESSVPQGDSDISSLTSVPEAGAAEGQGAIAFSDVPPSPDVVATLLPPTSPDQRAAQVQTGRTDPFAPVTATPVIVPGSPSALRAPQALPTVPVATLPSLPPVPFSTVPVPAQPTPAAVTPSQSAAVPQPQPSAPVVPVAQTIEVSGVVQVGGQTSVIVRVPNEGSSRSASVGDRLANGRVLVKRIEVGQGSDPIVVLEQDGVEIVRSISLMGS